MGDRFLLEIPAEAAYVGAARIFVATVARQQGLDEDLVEDLKLVVSEACGAAVRADDGDDAIRLVLERTGDDVALDVIGGPGPGGGPVEGDPTPVSFARSVGYDVIRSIYPEAVIERTRDSRAIVRVKISLGGKEALGSA